jgi:hypothetical protein
VARGTSADQQLALFHARAPAIGKAAALDEVVDWIAETSRAGPSARLI